MIVINHVKLARALRQGTVSETQRFTYYVLVFLFINLMNVSVLSAWLRPDSAVNGIDYAVDAVNMAIFAIGTLLAYRIHRAGDGRDFIARSICISVPVGIQTIILMIIGTAVISGADPADADGQTTLSRALLSIGLSLYFYGQIIAGIATAAHMKPKLQGQV